MPIDRAARERRADALSLFLVLLAFLIQVRTVFIPHIRTLQHLPLSLNQAVLAGAADNYYQFQMYLQAPLLDWLWWRLPSQSYPSFSLLYVAYYGAGACGFLFFLFRLCRRLASPAASAFACLYLVALYPMFWYDNYFHPSDPWGALLTAAAIGLILDGEDEKPLYFGALLLTGFLWEKTLFLPLSAGLARLLGSSKPRPYARVLALTALATAAGALGQILPRVLYGMNRAWDLAPLAFDPTEAPDMLLKAAALFGAPLAYQALYRKDIPLAVRCLSLQLPILMLCYILVYRSVVAGGFLYPFKEIRGLIVLVPCLWPALAMGLDRLFAVTSRQQHVPAAVIGSDGGSV